MSSYKFGKRVVELKQDVMDLKNERGDINDVAELLPEDPAVDFAVGQTVVGQESILDRVWICVTDKERKVRIIGSYSTGGVSKTTLLKQVNDSFRHQQHHFDVVICAVVSKLEKIQDDIGKKIGMSDDLWK